MQALELTSSDPCFWIETPGFLSSGSNPPKPTTQDLVWRFYSETARQRFSVYFLPGFSVRIKLTISKVGLSPLSAFVHSTAQVGFKNCHSKPNVRIFKGRRK